MHITVDYDLESEKKEFSSDLRTLEEKGIETDVAKELVKIKSIIDYATHSIIDTLPSGDDSVSQDVIDSFEEAHSYVEKAYYELQELFPID
ncbi:MAG TPA: hypothetical protein VK892_19750 [Pyrinomonadaceae bacterium]|nr:hypothetical protein [Pyrinomonadaceae bacterium]